MNYWFTETQNSFNKKLLHFAQTYVTHKAKESLCWWISGKRYEEKIPILQVTVIGFLTLHMAYSAILSNDHTVKSLAHSLSLHKYRS